MRNDRLKWADELFSEVQKVPFATSCLGPAPGEEVESRMVPWRFELAAIAVIFLILSPRSAAWAERDWAITLYSGRLTDSELSGSATWDFEFENSYVMDVGLSRRVYRFHDYFDAEIEGQVAEHYDETSQLLGALMFEFAFSLPKVPQWSIAGGIHHRSGAGGTFGGVRGASNAWVVGLRYSF